MPKYLKVNPHLSVEELEKRYRQAKGVTERNHYQIIWLMAQGKGSHFRLARAVKDGVCMIG